MSSHSDKNHRILVIDDNKAIHGDFREILLKPKAESSEMADFETALFGESAPQVEMPEFQIESAFQGQEGLDMISKSLMRWRLWMCGCRPGWMGSRPR